MLSALLEDIKFIIKYKITPIQTGLFVANNPIR